MAQICIKSIFTARIIFQVTGWLMGLLSGFLLDKFQTNLVTTYNEEKISTYINIGQISVPEQGRGYILIGKMIDLLIDLLID